MHLSPCMLVLVTYWTWEAVALLFPSVGIKTHIFHFWHCISPSVEIFSSSPCFFFFFLSVFLLFERSIWYWFKMSEWHLFFIDQRMGGCLGQMQGEFLPVYVAPALTRRPGIQQPLEAEQASCVHGLWGFLGISRTCKKEVFSLLGHLLTEQRDPCSQGHLVAQWALAQMVAREESSFIFNIRKNTFFWLHPYSETLLWGHRLLVYRENKWEESLPLQNKKKKSIKYPQIPKPESEGLFFFLASPDFIAPKALAFLSQRWHQTWRRWWQGQPLCFAGLFLSEGTSVKTSCGSGLWVMESWTRTVIQLIKSTLGAAMVICPL